EELGVPYHAHAINIGEGDQFQEEFLAISPNNKIPAIVDHEGIDGKPTSVFESGAILWYLAQKYEKFMLESEAERLSVMQWLMFQMGGVGPMLGQAHHFRIYAPEPISYAIDRYTNEAKRLYGVIDKRLAQSQYIAGDAYSVADMAIFPWLRSYERQGQKLEDFPHLHKWFDAISARPAVINGCAVLQDARSSGPISDKAREMMFGAAQYQKR
ncbi:MAG: glutathione binding-like protein, partial [Pseudomonadota bacterium]